MEHPYVFIPAEGLKFSNRAPAVHLSGGENMTSTNHPIAFLAIYEHKECLATKASK